MVRMRGVRIRVIALAALGMAFAATAASGASGAEPATSDAQGPPTTGRALIAVRTPELPRGRGAAAARRRQTSLDRSRELLSRVAERDGIEVAARSVPGGLLTTELDGSSIGDLRQRLATDPLVESVRPEGRFEFRYAPNDPAFSSADPNAPNGDLFQWNLSLQGFPAAWDLAKGAGAEVAVLDSGAYVAHPDLAGHISGTLDCSGLVCLGTDVTDTEGHGTHVAGLACADADNGYALASGGFDCSLYIVKVASGDMITYTAVINGIYAAVAHGADVINMSFGGGGADPNLRDAIDYAWGSGVIPVVAAANEPDPGSDYPAQYVQPAGTGASLDAGKGLVVTSANHSGVRTAWAQNTTGVSVAGVGSATDLKSGGQQGILSTWPATPVSFDQYGVRTLFAGDDRFAYVVGTSMASPQAAGMMALMRAAKPGIAASKAVRLAKVTASNCGPYGNGLGWGLIRADQAVGAALDKDVDPPASNVISARRSRKVHGAAAAKRRKGHAGHGNVTLKLKSDDAACSKELPSSGVKSISVFVSANDGPYRELAKTGASELSFGGKQGKTYRFYSVAVDDAGNREAAPAVADAKLRLKKKGKRKKGRR